VILWESKKYFGETLNWTVAMSMWREFLSTETNSSILDKDEPNRSRVGTSRVADEFTGKISSLRTVLSDRLVILDAIRELLSKK
jgi:hypothetical protein